jgi:D-serine deaminase-like pyridoxal phosphate-dependent protein
VSELGVETPAAVVDVDRLERNLERWQRECDRTGLANRPHVKTHKCAEIARRQLELGAVGLTCQTLGEAEAMADAGVEDVLIPYNLLGPRRLARLSLLLRRATVAVTVDSAGLLPGLAEAAAEASSELGVLVDCDTGLGRTGVQTPAEAAALAAEVAAATPLRFDGFLTHPALPEAGPFLAEAVRSANGLSARVVSVGGTPMMWLHERLRPPVTEYRAGTYAFHDLATIAAGAGTLDDAALTVAATVVSRPAPDRAIVDAGSKALSSDPGPGGAFGLILEAPASALVRLDEEHGYVSLAAGDRLELGRQVRIVPNHACAVSNLFAELVVVRGEEPVARWPVVGRR